VHFQIPHVNQLGNKAANLEASIEPADRARTIQHPGGWLESTVSNSRESITIPHMVQYINGSASSGVSNILIPIASRNLRLVVKSHFILDSSNATLSRYSGDESQIITGRHVLIPGPLCFSLALTSFETDSELTHTESSTFHSCPSFQLTVR
jgi:hypothetical protein